MKPETFDHAPIVKAWLDEPVWLAESDLGRIAQLVHQTQQQRRWLPTRDRRSFDTMSTATKVAIAGALVALVGGFVLSGAISPRPVQPLLPPGAELTSPTRAAGLPACSVASTEFASMAPVACVQLGRDGAAERCQRRRLDGDRAPAIQERISLRIRHGRPSRTRRPPRRTRRTRA